MRGFFEVEALVEFDLSRWLVTLETKVRFNIFKKIKLTVSFPSMYDEKYDCDQRIFVFDFSYRRLL